MEINKVVNIRYSESEIRSINRNRISQGGYWKKNKVPLDTKEIEKICKYLENPTKSGIWYLDAKWERKGGISKYIYDQINQELKDKEEIEIQSGKRKIKIHIKEMEKEGFFEAIYRMTFVFELFTYLYYLENEPLESISRYHNIEEAIFEIIDTKKLQTKYKESYDYFKKNIYFDGFNPIIRSGEIIRIKDGFFILTGESLENSDNLSIISINPSSLETFNIFFTKLDKLSDCSITPIFSPEEKVFTPYFSLLGETYSHFIDYENISRLFKKSIEEYRNGNYTYCVSTIGLIAEDYLTQIYETFFREICPKGLTLGQIYDSIHTNIQKKFIIKTVPNPEINPLYDNINKLIDKDSDGDVNISIEILKISRDVLNYIREDKTHTMSTIESLEKKGVTYSVFPKYLKENINELIRYRNATSHKSRIPIGNYEALRTVYCCITLLMWWINEKNSMNWKDTQDIILQNSIERNTGVKIN